MYFSFAKIYTISAMFKKIFFILSLSLNSFAVKIALSPQNISLEASPGATKGFDFTVSNYAKKGIANCKVFAQDLEITPDGEIVFLPVGSLTYSCAKWIKFQETSFAVKPGEAKKISGYVTIPRDKNINGSYDGIIICEFPPPEMALKEDMAGVGINLRLSLRIEVKVGRSREKLEIGKIEFLPEKKRFAVRIDNKGEASVLTQESNFLIKTKGSIIETLPLVSNRYTLLRNSSRIFNANFKKILPKGMYNIEAIIGYNEKYRVIGKGNIFVDKNGRITFLKEEEKEEKGISFEINPVIIFLSLPAGGFRTSIIKVFNKEQEPILVFMEAKDVCYNKGELQTTSSQTAYSVLPFIELFPTSLRLAPKQSGAIRYKAIVPKEEKGGKYGALSFSLATLHDKKDSFTLPFHLAILNTEERKIKIEEIKQVSKTSISFILKNEGNVLENTKQGNLLIKDKQKKVIKKIEFIAPPLFPQEYEEIKIEYPSLPKGEYSFEIEIEGKVIQEQKFQL